MSTILFTIFMPPMAPKQLEAGIKSPFCFPLIAAALLFIEMQFFRTLLTPINESRVSTSPRARPCKQLQAKLMPDFILKLPKMMAASIPAPAIPRDPDKDIFHALACHFSRSGHPHLRFSSRAPSQGNRVISAFIISVRYFPPFPPRSGKPA